MEFLGWTIVIVIVGSIVVAMVQGGRDADKNCDRALQLGIDLSDIAKWGAINEHMICPHCQNKGRVLTKQTLQKKGVSGAKATGAILTGGVSLVATGLSRKEASTQAHCVVCNSTWNF